MGFFDKFRDYVDPWNNKGFKLYKKGEYQEALECYDKALELDLNNSWVWHNKGMYLMN